MKKILLIIALTFYIFQLIVLAVAIDIGSPAVDRAAGTTNARRTYINKNNPANLSGTITQIEIWPNVTLNDCEVATFFIIGGDIMSTRDTHAIGNVTSGSKQTFSGLDIVVEVGDYIGITYSTGEVERDDAGAGYWYSTADKIPCTSFSFIFIADRAISLYGTGTTSWDGPFNTVTIGKWNTKEITVWNTIE